MSPPARRSADGDIPREEQMPASMNRSDTRPCRRPRDDLANSPFLKACRREPTDGHADLADEAGGPLHGRIPGPARRVPFLELCKRPELATEVTVTAAERLGVDAAILFADILLILEPLGFQLEFAKGEGPVIHNPVRSAGRRRPHPPSRRRPHPLDYVDPGRPLDPRRPPARSPPDRLRRRPVHPGLLRHRRGLIAPLRAGQGVHVRRSGGLGRADGAPGRRDGDLPERPGRGRGAGAPGLR